MGKKRLVNLEVDEVSLVDMPAIGEPIYITKSVKGANMKKVTKNADGTETVVEDPTVDPAAVVDPAVTEPDGATSTKAAAADPATPAAPTIDMAAINNTIAALVKSAVDGAFVETKKSITDLEEMLTKSLTLHESVGASMNEMLSLNMSALDAVMMLVASNENSYTEDQKSLISNIRTVSKSVVVEIAKAGAKISKDRLEVLRDLATKLSELISSVDKAEKTDGVEAVAKGLNMVTELAKRLETSEALVADIQKSHEGVVAKFEERLKAIENTAVASSELDDDDDGVEDTDTNKSTSVFKGLIPTDEIRKATLKRANFLAQ